MPLGLHRDRIEELVRSKKYKDSEDFVKSAVEILLTWESKHPEECMQIMTTLRPFSPEQEAMMKQTMKPEEIKRQFGELEMDKDESEMLEQDKLAQRDDDHLKLRDNYQHSKKYIQSLKKITVPKNAKPGELHHVVIRGNGEGGFSDTLDLFANLRQRWPQMAFPPAALLGVVPVAVIEPAHVTLATAKLKPGAKVKVRVTTRRPPEPIGLKAAPQAITIELKNLPAGLSAPDRITVNAKKDFVEIELTATADAKPGKADVVAVAKSKYRGVEWVRESLPVTIEVVPE